MDRKKFLQTLGISGAASVIPASSIFTTNALPSACTLIPTETAGPFPLDLTANTNFFRQDVRETKTGVRLDLKMKIVGLNNCEPMSNVRVNIWHCDKDGLYSGYNQNNNPGQAGLTYLRGYQFTDAKGEANFITIFPGWYTGRICHIHFQVYVSSSYAAISQLTFDLAAKNALYTANPMLYTKGQDPLSYNSDNIFSDGYTYQLATLAANSETGGYSSYLEVAVKGSGTVGLGHIERENAKQFVLGQNFPNPYRASTQIPLELKHPADVRLELWDLSGKKLATVKEASLSAGKHQIDVNVDSLGLAGSNYVYQVQVKNVNGIFKDVKMMTALD